MPVSHARASCSSHMLTFYGNASCPRCMFKSHVQASCFSPMSNARVQVLYSSPMLMLNVHARCFSILSMFNVPALYSSPMFKPRVRVPCSSRMFNTQNDHATAAMQIKLLPRQSCLKVKSRWETFYQGGKLF